MDSSIQREELPYVVCSNGFRSFQKYKKAKKWGDDDDVDVNRSRHLMCFATKRRPWAKGKDEDEDEDEDDDKVEDETIRILVRVYVVYPDDCFLYRVAKFMSSTDDLACASSGSKVFIFEVGQVSYYYMDLRGTRRMKRMNEWVLANEHLNRKKCHPVSFSVGGKIYVLDTRFISESGHYEPIPGEEEDHAYRFEVPDPRHPKPCWTRLSNPPYPFGMASIRGRWTQDKEETSGSDTGSDSGAGARIFIEAICEAFRCIFVYNVDKDLWNFLKPSYAYSRVTFPHSFDLVGSDFAPLPDTVSCGNLFALVDVNLCPLASAVPGSRLPTSFISDGKVLIDKKDQRFIKSTLSQEEESFDFNGYYKESLWTLHCLPLECLTFWQITHLGGSRFGILAFYIDTGCCHLHTQLHARLATFDITDHTTPVDVDPSTGGGRILDAKYVLNEVYTLGTFAADPLPCTQLFLA